MLRKPLKNITHRNSHQRCSVRKSVIRSFAKFTGKHLCQSLFFNKVAGLRPANLFKKRLTQVFSRNLCAAASTLISVTLHDFHGIAVITLLLVPSPLSTPTFYHRLFKNLLFLFLKNLFPSRMCAEGKFLAFLRG